MHGGKTPEGRTKSKMAGPGETRCGPGGRRRAPEWRESRPVSDERRPNTGDCLAGPDGRLRRRGETPERESRTGVAAVTTRFGDIRLVDRRWRQTANLGPWVEERERHPRAGRILGVPLEGISGDKILHGNISNWGCPAERIRGRED
ncbi:hypothetical protein NDU88_002220 [Pleurodeles waltl]|uniref:Uncharacterized protein n=1 Tax=Pleurodeles waltl TaxID=8319 RepID=A0AAV7M7I6_PLEWA|nr:hypothetical protein NDU88_002220 [Pleurodeles waltl]